MPLYEVTLQQQYYNQLVINRWNYVGSGIPAAVTPSFALLSALGMLNTGTTFAGGTVAGAIQGLQNIATTFVQATARAVYIDEDFYGNGFLAGTIGTSAVAGENMSPISAFGFRSSRVKQSIGRAYKRFVGMNEGAVLNGGVLNPAIAAAVEGVRSTMSEVLTYDDEGNSLTFSPCVAQKEKYTTPSGREAYRYYGTELLQEPHLAVGITWETYNEMRTQNSRQYGHGA